MRLMRLMLSTRLTRFPCGANTVHVLLPTTMTTATAGRDFTHLPPYRDARIRSERHRDEDHSDHRRRRLRPPIPDMRFEHIYIRSVKPYIHVEDAPNVEGDRAVKTVAGAGSGEVVRVQWGHVLLVTLRDQILSPLVQGILWCVRPSINTCYGY